MSGDLRRQLASIIVSHGEGAGPVEQEVRRRALAGLPMTRLQIVAYGEACYSVEVRTFLDDHGYHRLYRDDLSRAAEFQASSDGSSEHEIAEGGRTANRRRGIGRLLLCAIVALAALTTACIFLTRSPSVPEPVNQTFSQHPVVPRPASPTRSAEEANCRTSLRNAGVAWCVRGLTGSGPDIPLDGDFQRFDRLACGDPMAANAETLRRALDGIMDEGARYTYDTSDAARRCAAAGALVVVP